MAHAARTYSPVVRHVHLFAVRGDSEPKGPSADGNGGDHRACRDVDNGFVLPRKLVTYIMGCGTRKLQWDLLCWFGCWTRKHSRLSWY